jgi:protein-S-isoprenylcysteine O-methyltransferase Ste14
MVIAFIGFMIALLTVFELKTNLTVFPTPTQKAVLLTHGFFRYSRHPIYSGILMIAFGYAFYKYSVYKFVISGLLLIWFYLKSTYEEERLSLKFKNYNEYQKKVGRFFPKIK